MDGISDHDTLRAYYGAISLLAERKVIPRLDPHARAFIALSPFLVLATVDDHGQADASPRGDAPGFVLVLDDTTLLVPDRPGNNRVDSYGNVVANPGVGLIFLVPGIDETLRVNGTARVVTDTALLARAERQHQLRVLQCFLVEVHRALGGLDGGDGDVRAHRRVELRAHLLRSVHCNGPGRLARPERARQHRF